MADDFMSNVSGKSRLAKTSNEKNRGKRGVSLVQLLISSHELIGEGIDLILKAGQQSLLVHTLKSFYSWNSWI